MKVIEGGLTDYQQGVHDAFEAAAAFFRMHYETQRHNYPFNWPPQMFWNQDGQVRALKGMSEDMTKRANEVSSG